MDLLALPHVGPAADAAPASANVVHRLRLLVERHGVLPSVPVPAPARPPLSMTDDNSNGSLLQQLLLMYLTPHRVGTTVTPRGDQPPRGDHSDSCLALPARDGTALFPTRAKPAPPRPIQPPDPSPAPSPSASFSAFLHGLASSSPKLTSVAVLLHGMQELHRSTSEAQAQSTQQQPATTPWAMAQQQADGAHNQRPLGCYAGAAVHSRQVGMMAAAGGGGRPQADAPAVHARRAYQSQQADGAARTKADYVIVNTTTDVKNAAGAVAKVVGRASTNGHCPVFIRAASAVRLFQAQNDLSAVVSPGWSVPMTPRAVKSVSAVAVAVKTIAAARTYLIMDTVGHELAFQPYLRRAAAATATTPEMRPFMSDPEAVHLHALEKEVLRGLREQGHNAVLRSVDNVAAMAIDSGYRQRGPKGVRGEEHRGGGVGGREMAFDVYKVTTLPQLKEVDADGVALNVPMKLTSHSRPSTISNGIIKQVMEHGSAMIITAGGKVGGRGVRGWPCVDGWPWSGWVAVCGCAAGLNCTACTACMSA